MKIFDIYRWALPSRSALQQGLGEQMAQQLNSFYKSLQNDSTIFLLIAVGFSLLCFIIYYWPYNNRPGRHYRWEKWMVFTWIAFGLTWAASLIFGASIKAPSPQVWWRVMGILSVVNAFYASVLYVTFSFILSQFPSRWTKTNANLFMKIRRR